MQALCKTCNNTVCSPYATEYALFTNHIHTSPVIYDERGVGRLLSLSFNRLLLAKQISTMILTLEYVGFAETHTSLRSFVLDPNLTVQPQFRVLAFLVPNSPYTGTFLRHHSRVDTFAPGWGFVGGEISHYPFGFVYTTKIGLNYRPDLLTDITSWFTSAQNSVTPEVIRFYRRLTGVGSNAEALGFSRNHPQIDYL